MVTPNPNERLLRFLQATPEQQAAIDRILDGRLVPAAPAPLTGPLLMGMGAGARFLGVSRATVWRMIQAGRLKKVEVLPGSFRLRRADLEALAGGHHAEGHGAGGHHAAGQTFRSGMIGGQHAEAGA